MRIGFQGKPGAYSQEAILNLYSHPSLDIEDIPFDLSDDLFEALHDQQIDAAVIPVENSIAGVVSRNMDLMLKYDCYITQEYYLPITHHLLALPGGKIENLTSVMSHPVALGQCHHFISKYKLKTISEFDTAGSCELLIEQNDYTRGVVASKLCAEKYNLEVLSNDIQEVKNNMTRFFIIRNKKCLVMDDQQKSDKVSMAFSTPHHPGALLDCLKVFDTYALNLTRLESRPIPENPFVYTFFVDFLADFNDPMVGQAINLLKRKTNFLKIMGHYKNARDNA